MPIVPQSKPPEIPTRTLRLNDFSLGLNTTISPTLLGDNELQVANNVSLEQKGTIVPSRGRVKRYSTPFANVPTCGLGAYYKKDGTTKLLAAAGSVLYADTPGIVNKWTTQADYEESGSARSNADTSTTPGSVKMAAGTTSGAVAFSKTEGAVDFSSGTLSDVWGADDGLRLETTAIRTWNDFTGASWEVLS